MVYVFIGGKGRNLLGEKQYQYNGNTHLIDRFLGVINYFHTMGIGFPRIYGGEPCWTYFGELPRKWTFYRGI